MALLTVSMTANEARGFAQAHQVQLDNMEGTSTEANMEATLTAIGSAILSKMFATPIPTIVAVVGWMVTVTNNSNTAAIRSHLKGARDAFYQIESMLNNNSDYVLAEVQQVWVNLPASHSQTRYVEGVESNPAQGYRVMRILLTNGNWLESP